MYRQTFCKTHFCWFVEAKMNNFDELDINIVIKYLLFFLSSKENIVSIKAILLCNAYYITKHASIIKHSISIISLNNINVRCNDSVNSGSLFLLIELTMCRYITHFTGVVVIIV